MDASVWVSRLVAGDVHHARTRRWFERQDREASLLVVPALMLPEVAGAIARRTGDARLARRAMDRLLRLANLRLIPLDRVLAGSAASLAAGLKLRGTDAIYVAVAQLLNLPLVTWDREQLARAGGAVTASKPE